MVASQLRAAVAELRVPRAEAGEQLSHLGHAEVPLHPGIEDPDPLNHVLGRQLRVGRYVLLGKAPRSGCLRTSATRRSQRENAGSRTTAPSRTTTFICVFSSSASSAATSFGIVTLMLLPTLRTLTCMDPHSTYRRRVHEHNRLRNAFARLGTSIVTPPPEERRPSRSRVGRPPPPRVPFRRPPSPATPPQ